MWDAAAPDKPQHTLATSSAHSLYSQGSGSAAGGLGVMERPVWAATDVTSLSMSGHVIAASAAPLMPRLRDAQSSVSGGSGSAPEVGAAASQHVAATLSELLFCGWGLHVFDVRASPTAVVTGCTYPALPGGTSIFYDDASLNVVVGGSDGSLLLYDMRMQRERLLVPGVPLHAARRKPSTLAAGSAGAADGDASLPPQVPLFGHLGAVTCMARHPSHRVLVSGGQDGEVKVWSLPDLAYMSSIAKLHDGLTIATATAAASSNSPFSVESNWVHMVGVSGLSATEDHVMSTGYDGAVYAIRQSW
ncbi:hypothetical protein EON62_04745 [archaeon]|nr:MAG: hypothetical protein EON62_04745 [archaeon]